MSLSVRCPSCQSKLNAPENLAGKRVKCPKCQAAVNVPAAAPAASGVPAAAPVAPLKPVVVSQPASPTAALQPVAVSMPEAPAAKGGVPILLAVTVGVGGLLLLGGVAIIAVLWFLPAGARPIASAPPAAITAPPPPPPVPIAAPAPPAVELATAPAVATLPPPIAETVEWVAHEDSARGFKAVFPGSAPETIDPLATVANPQQRELAAAMMKEWIVLGVKHGSRSFKLTAAPLVLGSVPASTYLDRLSVTLPALHAGFSIEPQPPADRTTPVRDFLLKRDDAGKLLRVIVGQGHVFHLLVEGQPVLAFNDAAVQPFFEQFQCTGAVVPAVASAQPGPSTPTGKKRQGDDAEAPDGIDWRPLQGAKIAFTLQFPAAPAVAQDPLSLIANERDRQTIQEQWAKDQVVAESYGVTIGDRRFSVTAWCDPNLRQEGSIRFEVQLDRLTRGFVQNLFDEVRTSGLGGPRTSKGMKIGTVAYMLRAGGKAIAREAQLGHYCFVAWVEGPRDLPNQDPVVHKFLNSLQPPPDAAPLPLNVKPLPGSPASARP